AEERVIENAQQIAVFGILSGGVLIKDSDTNFFYSQGGARAEPVLRGSTGDKPNQEKREEELAGQKPCPQLSGVIVHEKQEFQLFPVVIEPKLNRNLISGVIRRQGTKSVNALKSPYSRLVQRRHAAGLLNLHIARAAVASDVKGEIHAI